MNNRSARRFNSGSPRAMAVTKSSAECNPFSPLCHQILNNIEIIENEGQEIQLKPSKRCRQSDMKRTRDTEFR